MQSIVSVPPFPRKRPSSICPVRRGSPAPFCAAEPEEGGRRLGLHLSAEDIVYGLGEQPRGINKRGWIYRSWNTDDPIHTEGIPAMYGSHNFFVVCGEKPFGAFFDCAGRMTFDVGYTDPEELTVTAYEDFDLYIIRPDGARETAENQGDRTPAPVLSPVEDIVRQFRALIGQSYIPPKWGFGYAQSRLGIRFGGGYPRGGGPDTRRRSCRSTPSISISITWSGIKTSRWISPAIPI